MAWNNNKNPRTIVESIFWYQNNPDELVFRYPRQDITMGSVLTVHEGQEAYLYVNGAIFHKFTPGRYVMHTQNLPILNKLVNLVSGGVTTYLAEVWFVSKLEKRNMLWGTGGMRLIDPYFQIPVKVAARGQYGFRIIDGGMFLKKFIGSIQAAGVGVIQQQFRADVVEGVKVATARHMKENNLSINDVATEYRKLSSYIYEDLKAAFDEYGVELMNFNIEDVSIDENDPGYKTVMEGVAENARLKQLGVNYMQQKQIDIAETAAGNEGAGAFMGVGIGLGAGSQMGRMVSNAMQQSGIFTPPAPQGSLYYISNNGQATGPYPVNNMSPLVSSGQLTPNTYVYRVGGSSWNLAANEPDLAPLFGAPAPPPPPVPAPPVQ